MKDSSCIVLCGASIYMLAIESGLSAMVGKDVVRINPFLPNTVEHISELKPHVVIIERNGKYNKLALEILCQSIPLIVLDEDRCFKMYLIHEYVPKSEINELTHVIDKINRQQVVSPIERINRLEER